MHALRWTVLATTVACAPGNLSRTDAERTYSAVAYAFGPASVEIAGEEGRDTYDPVNGTYDCPQGGSLTAVSSFRDLSADRRTYTYESSLSYDACVSGGVVIDGTSSGRTTMTDGTGEGSVSGILTFSGDVDGYCVLDFQSTVDIDRPESAKTEGQWCGFDVTELTIINVQD